MTNPITQQASSAAGDLAATAAKPVSAPARPTAEVTAADKEKKRKERLQELKVELHKRLLENLNLAALEHASENNLKQEIGAIANEAGLDAKHMGRIEIFDDTLEPNRAAPSGDFGLIFTRELGWAAWDTSLNFVPSFQVTGDYYVRHESSLNLLRSSGPLSLRVGLANNFRSKPLPMQVKTDTAYFLRTTYVWK